MDTRLRKALDGQYDAIILAGAGLIRLGLDGHVTEWLSLDIMLPAPGQGALAVQCRADDQTTLSLLAALEDEIHAESGYCRTRLPERTRRRMRCTGGGICDIKTNDYTDRIGRFTEMEKMIKVTGEGNDSLQLGNELAQNAIAQGANEILAGSAVK